MSASSDQTAMDETTPERFVPATMAGELAEAEHLARYRWASTLVDGRRVLDAACGTAYGSALMAAAGAASVVGVDIAEGVVESARPGMPANVELRAADVQDLPFADDAFDVVVCFETIEHVQDRDGTLDELARVLAPGGVLAISSPNRDAYMPGNPHHVFEYTSDELEGALHTRFQQVRMFRQQGLIGAAVLGDDDHRAGAGAPIAGLEAFKAVEGVVGDETFVVALAADGPLPDLPPVMVTTGLVEVRRWVELYDEQQDVLRRQNEHMDDTRLHREELVELRRRLREAEQELAVVPDLEQDARITQAEHDRLQALEREAAEREALLTRVAELEAECERARGVYRGMQASLSWRITGPLRRLKGR